MMGRSLAVATAFLALGAAPAPSAPAARPCAAAVDRGVLPVWARTGFSEAKPKIPHILGRSGRVVAILFAQTLYAPPLPRRNNKILWVARTPLSTPSNLRISAQRMTGRTRVGKPAARVVPGGPGPSIIDLPRPGCWRLTLTWAHRTDQLDLEYKARPAQ
jgi:hypothetical protein